MKKILGIVGSPRKDGNTDVLVSRILEGAETTERAVDPGPVVGNDYVVRSGLKPGDRLIVSGVQKIADGAPVTILASRAAESPRPEPASGG